MGGYVCFPGGLMAKALLGKPLMLVNADAALLLSNRSLLPVADRVAFGFEGDARASAKHAVVTGNPVRAEIEALPRRPALCRPQRPAARAGGGRQPGRAGAQPDTARRAGLIPAASARWSRTRPAAHLDAVRAAYARPVCEAEVLPFIDDMARAWPPAT
jgi:UDP-N-acetylglucosamine--N-acetylmuramyl-(pentapeptide) pyrophosphoryl-undecaprenol N-acetylglucosamine transferase